MREIKFRAYDLDRKEFDYFTLDTYDKNNHDVYGTLEQYTGLKDKNGVEIYDGDKIRVYDWSIRSLNNILGECYVEWNKEENGWRYSHFCETDDWYDLFRNVEIIGNIHEVQDA